MKSREGKESSHFLESSNFGQQFSLLVHQPPKNSQQQMLEDGPKHFKSVWEKLQNLAKPF